MSCSTAPGADSAPWSSAPGTADQPDGASLSGAVAGTAGVGARLADARQSDAGAAAVAPVRAWPAELLAGVGATGVGSAHGRCWWPPMAAGAVSLVDAAEVSPASARARVSRWPAPALAGPGGAAAGPGMAESGMAESGMAHPPTPVGRAVLRETGPAGSGSAGSGSAGSGSAGSGSAGRGTVGG
jgi:hypothetical protein